METIKHAIVFAVLRSMSGGKMWRCAQLCHPLCSNDAGDVIVKAQQAVYSHSEDTYKVVLKQWHGRSKYDDAIRVIELGNLLTCLVIIASILFGLRSRSFRINHPVTASAQATSWDRQSMELVSVAVYSWVSFAYMWYCIPKELIRVVIIATLLSLSQRRY